MHATTPPLFGLACPCRLFREFTDCDASLGLLRGKTGEETGLGNAAHRRSTPRKPCVAQPPRLWAVGVEWGVLFGLGSPRSRNTLHRGSTGDGACAA